MAPELTFRLQGRERLPQLPPADAELLAKLALGRKAAVHRQRRLRQKGAKLGKRALWIDTVSRHDLSTNVPIGQKIIA